MTPEGQGQIPFLKRNFARAVNAFSGAFGSPGLVHGENHPLAAGDNTEHPRKRRRVSTPDSFLDKGLASQRSSVSYPMLRIEVLRCHHRDAKRDRGSFGSVISPDATTEANCRITISDMTLGRPKVLHCNSQLCKVVTFKDPARSHRIARVELPHPFHVPRDKILVNSLDDDSFDIAGAYKLSVELESTDGSNWPPLNKDDLENALGPPLESTPTRHWVFSASFDDLFGRLKAPLILTANTFAVEGSQTTDYELHVDLQWSSGYLGLEHLENVAKTWVTEIDPNGLTPRGRRGTRRAATPESVGSQLPGKDDGMDGDNTPSRGLRTRGADKNYNLKTLSDMAHGRKRRQRRGGHTGNEGRVLYFLPPDQPFALDSFRCVNCGIMHQSLKHLQLHLRTTHPEYGYKLQMTDDGPQFLVSGEPESPSTPSKSFVLKYPKGTFDIGSFLAGDDSWVGSRMDTDIKPTSRGKSVPQASSPETRLSRNRKIIIPKTPHILYHPVSKQELKAGQEVPEAVVEKDWIYHRHIQGLNDVDDVTPAELEYMKEFDDVMHDHDITARVYFPRAWMDFVQRKAGWLVGAQHRMKEFALHESFLLSSDLLKDEHIQEAAGYIEDAWMKERKMQKTSPDGEESTLARQRKSPEPDPKKPPVRKSASGCGSCMLPVINGPRTLICANQDCKKRLFHAECVPRPPTTRAAKSTWTCDGCSAVAAARASGSS